MYPIIYVYRASLCLDPALSIKYTEKRWMSWSRNVYIIVYQKKNVYIFHACEYVTLYNKNEREFSIGDYKCNISSCDIWKNLKELIWLYISPKLTYFFRHTSIENFIVKHVWDKVIEGWVIYRKVICDSVRVRSKHEKKSCDDCRISKQWFRIFEKIKEPNIGRNWDHRLNERASVTH